MALFLSYVRIARHLSPHGGCWLLALFPHSTSRGEPDFVQVPCKGSRVLGRRRQVLSACHTSFGVLHKVHLGHLPPGLSLGLGRFRDFGANNVAHKAGAREAAEGASNLSLIICLLDLDITRFILMSPGSVPTRCEHFGRSWPNMPILASTSR